MSESVKFENLVELFERSVKLYGPRDLFGTRRGDDWVWTSYAEMGTLVDQCRGGLSALGVKRGDNVCIISNNRVEWAVVAYACYGLGAALVPMYEAQLPKEWAFIANDCGAVAVVSATTKIHAEWKALDAPSIKHRICFDLPKDDAESYQALLEKGKGDAPASIHPEPRDTACLIYTSGTTGNPKGVILSHGNVASNITAIHDMLPMGGEDRSLSFLPWAHSFGHTCELHALLSLGASIALNDDVTKLIGQLAEVKPTVLFSVPRIFNRIYDGVNKQMQSKPAIIRSLFRNGLRAASKQRDGVPLGVWEKLTLSLANKLVFSKIRARFGGRMRYAFSGGAALSRDIAEFVDSLGITVYEGYGLTETSPIATANRPGARRIGSVGKPIPGVKIVIEKSQSGSDEKSGEIVIYGPNVMMGYYNRDEENKAALTEDRGFRSGDLGYVDDDGFLFITGRIKELYKLENGKYVAPAPLEESLKLSPFILNAMIYGDNRLYNTALVVADVAAVESWAEQQGIGDRGDALLDNPKVRELLFAEVDKCSASWKGFEKVKKICVIGEDFTTQNGLLTPSLKLKRRVAWQKYGPRIEALYAEAPAKSPSAQASAN